MEEDFVLREKFTAGQLLFKDILNSELSGSDPDYQQQITTGIQIFKEVLQLVRENHVYSANEELEDIRTDLLEFVLADYYYAQIIIRISQTDLTKRLQNLEKVSLHFEQFLSTLNNWKFLLDEEKEMFKREDYQSNPELSRQDALFRHKSNKETSFKIEFLEKKKKKSMEFESSKSQNATAISWDEEDQRELILSIIKNSVSQALGEKNTLVQEISMLKQILEMKNNGEDPLSSENREKSRQKASKNSIGNFKILPDGTTIPLDSKGNSLNQNNKKNVNTIGYNSKLQKQQEIKNEMFTQKNTWTLTPEQWMEQNQEYPNSQPQGSNSVVNEYVGYSEAQSFEKSQKYTTNEDSEDSDDNDESTQKKRDWDEFKDDNPTGWGNKGGNVG